jgi:gluconate 2-dehydrogenase subunit 3-like protein
MQLPGGFSRPPILPVPLKQGRSFTLTARSRVPMRICCLDTRADCGPWINTPRGYSPHPLKNLAASSRIRRWGDLESGKIAELRDGEAFFELLRTHVLEGVFGEPSYGGNRDMIGWKLVGFPGQQWGYPETYINKVVDLPPVIWEGLPKKPGQS